MMLLLWETDAEAATIFRLMLKGTEV